MRIAMLLPVADRPTSRAYALWANAARELATALESRSVEVASTLVHDPGPGRPVFQHGISLVDDSLRVAQLFRRANDFDLVHDLSGFAALGYASFVSAPVLATVWMDMWQSAETIYRDLNQRVFYHAPGDRDRRSGLLYSATIPWTIDASKLSPSLEHDSSLVYAGQLTADGGVRAALDLASRSDRRLVVVGAALDDDSVRSLLASPIAEGRVRWIEDPASAEADLAIRRAAALVHIGECDGLQQLVLLDAASGGTPIVAIGDLDQPCWLRDGQTGVLCRSLDEALAAASRLDSWSRSHCRESAMSDRPFDAFVSAIADLYARIVKQQQREDRRPWGYYQVLSDEPTHKVKRLVVFPGKRLSLQRHRHRDEHWYLLDGEAAVVQDEEEIRLLRGQSIEIPKGCWHRIRNPGAQNLTLIEVQTGDYFGEDDIERKEDDFGRT